MQYKYLVDNLVCVDLFLVVCQQINNEVLILCKMYANIYS